MVRGPAALPVVLVNLDGADLRRARMARQLRTQGVAFERVGHDFRVLDRSAIQRWYADRFRVIRPSARRLSGAELGCWASHLEAWDRIRRSGAGCGVVLEDDVLLAASFRSCIDVLAVQSDAFDVVYLGTSSRNLSRRRVSRVAGLAIHDPVGAVFNTWGYVVATAWIERVFALPELVLDLPLDHFLGGRGRPARPRLGVLQPPCVRDDPATAAASQIGPHTRRFDRLAVVEALRRRFLGSRAGDWFYRLYRWL